MKRWGLLLLRVTMGWLLVLWGMIDEDELALDTIMMPAGRTR